MRSRYRSGVRPLHCSMSQQQVTVYAGGLPRAIQTTGGGNRTGARRRAWELTDEPAVICYTPQAFSQTTSALNACLSD